MDILFISLSILFFIIEIFLIIFLLLKIKRYHKLTLKDTIIYPIIILLTTLTLLAARYYYLKETGAGVITASLKDSINIVALSINTDIVKNLFKHFTASSKFVMSIYIGEYVISALALFSISISLINVAFWNTKRRIFNLFSVKNKEVDYILGYTDNTKEYIKTYYEEYINKETRVSSNHKTVVVLDSSTLNSFEDEKFYLHKYKIPFRTKPYSLKKDIYKTINSLAKGIRNKRIITFFDSDKQNFLFINSALSFINNNKDKNIEFIIVSDINQEKFLNDVIYDYDENSGIIDKSLGKIKIFNKHNLISFEFIKNHNLAKYFPKGLINDDFTVNNEIDINLFVFGFGKVNQAILRDTLITNQFVTKEESNGKYKLKPKRINVEIYDKNYKIECLELFNGIFKYRKDKYNKDRYLDLDDDYISYINLHSNSSLYEEDVLNKIFENINNKSAKKPQVNYFLISLDSDFINANVAKKIKNNFDHINNTFNTYFVRFEEDIYDLDNDFITFGKNNDVLKYDNIVGNHLYDTANKFQDYYIGHNNNGRTPTPLESKCNYYNVCSLYFKLSLLLLKKEDNDIYDDNTLQKLMDKYYIIPNEIKNYDIAQKDSNINKTEFYDNLCEYNESYNAREVFSFIEHQRWNAYELSIGALPMSKDYAKESLDRICKLIIEADEPEKIKTKECSYDKDKKLFNVKFNKTKDELYHLCITSEYGLKQYYIFLSELIHYAEEKYNLKLKTGVDVVIYDYKYMDIIKSDLDNNKELKKIYDELFKYLTNGN